MIIEIIKIRCRYQVSYKVLDYMESMGGYKPTIRKVVMNINLRDRSMVAFLIVSGKL